MEMVHKVTLSSGKVVLVRDPKIKHQTLAAKAAAPKAGDNNTLLAMYIQQELVKILVAEIDGKAPSLQAMEDLDSIFSVKEYAEMGQVLGKLAGVDDQMGKFQIETATSGNK